MKLSVDKPVGELRAAKSEILYDSVTQRASEVGMQVNAKKHKCYVSTRPA